MNESERTRPASGKIVLRECKASSSAPITGYRLAIEAHGLGDIVLSSVKIEYVGGPYVVSELPHNRQPLSWNILGTNPDNILARLRAAKHLREVGNNYSRELGLSYEEALGS